MNKRKGFHLSRVAAACLCVALLVGASTAVYAADIGGIQRTIQVWIHGDQTNATLTVDNGSYSLSYKDLNGKIVEQAGGGVAIDEDGTERALSEAEIAEHLNAPDIVYTDDGKVIVYYYDQALDITDQFDDGVCYVQLVHNGEVLYMTVKYDNGYSTSPNKYPSPNI